MPKVYPNTIKYTHNTNIYIASLLENLRDDISFEIKKYSARTNLCDISNENFLSFLQSNGYNVIYKIGQLNVPIFSVRISKNKTKTHFAFDLVSAIKAALDEFELIYKDSQKEQIVADKDENEIVHNVINQQTVQINSRKTQKYAITNK
jgi:hypothetical protein